IHHQSKKVRAQS
ncbi:hypothetical protein Zm00014a_008988, partial [Zea mays]